MFSLITTFAFARIGNINQEEKPIITKVTQRIEVLICLCPFSLVYFKLKYIIATNSIPAIIDPELKGKPTVLTKNISRTLKNLRMFGANNLKIKSKIATEATLAIMKFLIVTVL